MKKNKTEVLFVRDYDNGDIIDCFTTDDASACRDALQDIDCLDATFSDDDDGLKHNNQELVEELGKRRVKTLIELKEEDSWVEALFKLCKYRKIKIEQAETETYDY